MPDIENMKMQNWKKKKSKTTCEGKNQKIKIFAKL